MNPKDNDEFEDVPPNPEYLIKSISEQGYSLESALADLMDNSISADADKIEILADTDCEPFALYLADNGNGMDVETLKQAMKFPSSSPELFREKSDLGRFGLGLKTASFSQTRRFTILSRKKGTNEFSGRTWDIKYLKNGKWNLLVNSNNEIEDVLSKYRNLSKNHINQFTCFDVNTVIIWQGLYKYEDYIEKENRKEALKKELTEVTAEHIEIVFHRFMERKKLPLQVRINNQLLAPFNPFPTKEKDFRSIEPLRRKFGEKSVAAEGFILPSRSIDEVQQGASIWTNRNRSLMGLEGLYVYRCNRIILFGGWSSLIKKGPRLQLARLRLDIGNGVDDLINLNVAKSQLKIPYELKKGFESYALKLKGEAEKEFYNRGRSEFSKNLKPPKEQIFFKKSSSRGVILELNNEFPIISSLKSELEGESLSKFNFLLKMINTNVNKIRRVHEEKEFIGVQESDGLSIYDVRNCVQGFLDLGLTSSIIRRKIISELGFSEDSFPPDIQDMLEVKNAGK